jgi:hypothetical protein
MNKPLRWSIPLAALGIASLGLALPTGAQAAEATSFQATLNPLNHSTASGDIMIKMNGSQVTVTEHVSGLAASFGGNPYPHVQHIHINGQGQCPSASADKNGDGVVSTTEGQPDYGPIGTTLSTSGDTSPKAAVTLTVAPSGGSFTYTRTFALDAASMASVKAGKGVVVIHGLDPATLSKKAQAAKSDIVPALPLAATSPALCGVLSASQMTNTPGGSPETGGGSTAGIQDEGLLAIGGGLLVAAGGAFFTGRRFARQS